MNIEHRAMTGCEVRVSPDSPRTFEAVVLRYGVIDDYKTIFDPGVFTASLEDRMPKITWAHDWSEPIGRWVDHKDTDEELRLIGELDDLDAVPRARQASAQLSSGTIDQFSVGFHREEGGTYEDDNGITHFRSAGLDEVALVLVGAVPGTKLLAVRSAGLIRQVPEAFVIDLAKQVASGSLSKAEAAAALDLAAGETPPVVVPVVDDGTVGDADHVLEGMGL